MKCKFFKIVSLVLSAVLAAVCMTSVFAADLIGDVNSDGAITSSDALALLQYSVGDEPENFNILVADLTLDGVINSSDALKVLEICVGLAEDPNKPVDPDPEEPDPIPQTKEEIVAYYNQALLDSYAAEQVQISYNTNVEVIIDKFEPKSLLGLANDLLAENAKPTSKSKIFKNGVSAEGKTPESFLVPTKLEADGAASATITETENGCKVVITLVSETCDHKGAPKYNTQASLPLAIPLDEVEKYGAKINSSSFTYPGTVITAEIDNDGHVTSLNHSMDLFVKADGRYIVQKVAVEGHGSYTLDANFDYTIA